MTTIADFPEPAVYRRGTDLLRGRWALVAVVVVSSFLGGLAEAFALFLITQVAFSTTGLDLTFAFLSNLSAGTLLLMSVSFVAVRLGFAVISSRSAASLSTTLGASIKKSVLSAFLTTSWATQQGERTGRLQELVSGFSARGAQIASSMVSLWSAVFSLIAIILFAVVADLLGSLIVIMAVVVLGSALGPLRRMLRLRGRAMVQTTTGLSERASEYSMLGQEMHTFAVQPQLSRTMGELVEAQRSAQRRLTVLQSLIPIIYISMAYLSIILLLWVATATEIVDLVTLGPITLLMVRALSYGQAIQTHLSSMTAARPFLDSLSDEIDKYTHGRKPRGVEEPPAEGGVRFSNVSFAYEPGVPVLKALSFEVERGEIVGIMGPSGSGKSTLVQLLIGLREAEQGTVRFGEIDVRSLSTEALAQHCSFVPQRPRVVKGSIEENVRFFRPWVDAEAIQIACREAFIHDEILQHPDGYDRILGDAGAEMSGGQQQRLIIARSLAGRPRILVLDEPTSALDLRSEHYIRETLLAMKERATVFIIAHRLSTLDICDRLMVMKDGEMIAFDQPASLRQSSDFYREALDLSGLLTDAESSRREDSQGALDPLK